MTQVKICGINTPEALHYAIKYHADFIGFVFHQNSARYITTDAAKTLCSQCPAATKTVGLFVDTPLSEIIDITTRLSLDLIQLHGNQTHEDIKNLRAHSKASIMRAIGIQNSQDIKKAQSFEPLCDWLLLDNSQGGSGQSFDWHLLQDYKPQIPWMLAGGLTDKNVSKAITQLWPDAVDVSSGVESKKGIKDHDKIKDFIAAVRQTD